MQVMNEQSTTQNHPQNILRVIIIAALLIAAGVLRIAPHPYNLAPIGAMALFAGAMIRTRWIAITLPLAALFVGDVFIGFHKLMLVVYASFAVSVAIGRWLATDRSVVKLGGAVFLGALQFFLVTNLAVWALLGAYPRTTAGLAACYVAGIPFLWNTLVADALYSTVLFGGYALAERLFALPVEDDTTHAKY